MKDVEYEAVIGLEVHVQIRTKSKMFCGCPNEWAGEPNTRTCPICMGYPGTLPTPNREAIRKTIIAGLMCDCDIPGRSKFDRKSYFYPDMPKNYQISQYDLPLCGPGRIPIGGRGFGGSELPDKTIGITRIHLEEDVAKSTHFATGSGIDFNRAGIPLMEIVSDPDMRTADEAYAYLAALKQIMQYAEIGDCDMEKGQLRCDVNISLRKQGETAFGVKIEIKNLNSFRSVHRSIEHEMVRQARVLDGGGSLSQETRAWNDERGETFLLRSKEDAHDYRYFPEPDLMPLEFQEPEIAEFRSALPELPQARRERFTRDFGLTPYDARVLTAEKSMADYFDAGAKTARNPKLLANWVISELLRELAERNIAIDAAPIPPEHLAELTNLIETGTISGKIAKDVFPEMLRTGNSPAKIVQEKGLLQVSDSTAIDRFVEEAIRSNPEQVRQYREGKTQVLQFFVGQVMKLSKGKANPQMAVERVRAVLDQP
jgi:aspartyl-tRNA(Asn)/glutamyl-tRNA(Gln) amidotransferase subunit B